MSTFLEIAQALQQSLGISGTLTTVTGQVGQLKKICDCVIQANRNIQNIHTDWNFLHTEYSTTLSSGDETYTPTSIPRRWDIESAYLDYGTDDEMQLSYLEYKVFRKTRSNEDNGTPDTFTILPSGIIQFAPPANDEYDFSIYGWSAPVDLSSDDDESLIPEHLTDIILHRAEIIAGRIFNDNGLVQIATIEYNQMLEILESEQLMYNDSAASESNLMVIRAV